MKTKAYAIPGLFFIYFHSLQATYRIKTADLSNLSTDIVGLKGKHADHLTTATVQKKAFDL